MPIPILSQLFSSLCYLRISVPAKPIVDFVLPLVLALGTCGFFYYFGPVAFLHGTGFISHINGLLQMLVGFYVAALAAVATFQNSSLEQNVISATLQKSPVKRRKFLSLLFGYLATLSLLLYLAGVFALLTQRQLAVIATNLPTLRWFLIFVYSFLVLHMISITLLGLHYLVDRIHRADPVVLNGPTTPDP